MLGCKLQPLVMMVLVVMVGIRPMVGGGGAEKCFSPLKSGKPTKILSFPIETETADFFVFWPHQTLETIPAGTKCYVNFDLEFWFTVADLVGMSPVHVESVSILGASIEYFLFQVLSI